jgi:hypothetical protein
MTGRLEAAVAAALAVHDGPRVLIRTEAFGRHSKSVGTPWTKHFMVHHQPPKGWHALRHAFCTRLALQGVPPTQIQKLAGHKSLKTTMRYMHTVDAALKAAVQVLETGHRFVPPPPPPPRFRLLGAGSCGARGAVVPMPQATPEKLPQAVAVYGTAADQGRSVCRVPAADDAQAAGEEAHGIRKGKRRLGGNRGGVVPGFLKHY